MRIQAEFVQGKTQCRRHSVGPCNVFIETYRNGVGRVQTDAHGIHNTRDRCVYQVEARRSAPRIMRIPQQDAAPRFCHSPAERNGIASQTGCWSKLRIAGSHRLTGRLCSGYIVFEPADSVANAQTYRESGNIFLEHRPHPWPIITRRR